MGHRDSGRRCRAQGQEGTGGKQSLNSIRASRSAKVGHAWDMHGIWEVGHAWDMGKWDMHGKVGNGTCMGYGKWDMARQLGQHVGTASERMHETGHASQQGQEQS